MLDTLTIHLGPPKTGSTSIQKLLHKNRKRLFKHGLIYPRSAGIIHHNDFAASLSGLDNVASVQAIADRSFSVITPNGTCLLGDILASGDITEKHSMMLSAEGFSGTFSNAEKAELTVNWANSVAHRTELILVHRDPLMHFASELLQNAYASNDDDEAWNIITSPFRDDFRRRSLPRLFRNLLAQENVDRIKIIRFSPQIIPSFIEATNLKSIFRFKFTGLLMSNRSSSKCRLIKKLLSKYDPAAPGRDELENSTHTLLSNNLIPCRHLTRNYAAVFPDSIRNLCEQESKEIEEMISGDKRIVLYQADN